MVKAREYPEDERNQASADALRALAEWITDHGDSLLVRDLDRALDRLYADVDAASAFSADMHNHLSRYGFCNGEPEAPEAFLGGLVKDIKAHLTVEQPKTTEQCIDEAAWTYISRLNDLLEQHLDEVTETFYANLDPAGYTQDEDGRPDQDEVQEDLDEELTEARDEFFEMVKAAEADAWREV